MLDFMPERTRNSIAAFVVAAVVALGSGACTVAKWEGDFYPSDASAEPVALATFRSLDACREAARPLLDRDPKGRVECAKNCKGGHAGIYFCEEIVR